MASDYRIAIETATQAARAGDAETALQILENALGKAVQSEAATEVGGLARQGGITAWSSGDLQRAQDFLTVSFVYTADLRTLFALAQILKERNKLLLAKACLNACRRGAAEARDEEVLELVIAADSQWF
jgi:hypothetical protein